MSDVSIANAVDVIRSIQSFGYDLAAAEALRYVLAEHTDAIRTDYALMQDVVFAAFQLGDHNSITQALTLHFPRLLGAKVGYETVFPIDINTVRWDVHADGTSQFLLSPKLEQLDRNWMFTIVSRWTACLYLADRYAGSVRRSGTAFLDVGDWSNGPAMCFSDCRTEALLVPDSSFLGSQGYSGARAWGSPGVAPAWADRRPVALWRGSSTGVVTGRLEDLPRARLSALSAGSTILDAGISDVVQKISPEELDAFRDKGLCRPHVGMQDHVNYKIQIDIDGNSNSWPGLFQKLLTGSPVIKVLSPERYKQWYYHRLVPWHNYVPVKSDLSDLMQILEYLLKHDDLAHAIGTAGRALAIDMTLDAELERAIPTIEAAFALGSYTTRDHQG